MVPAQGAAILNGSDSATAAIHQRIEARLSPLLGAFTAKMAIKTFALSKLGLTPEQLNRTHVPALLEALKPMLNTLAGATKSAAVIEQLRKELA